MTELSNPMREHMREHLNKRAAQQEVLLVTFLAGHPEYGVEDVQLCEQTDAIGGKTRWWIEPRSHPKQPDAVPLKRAWLRNPGFRVILGDFSENEPTDLPGHWTAIEYRELPPAPAEPVPCRCSCGIQPEYKQQHFGEAHTEWAVECPRCGWLGACHVTKAGAANRWDAVMARAAGGGRE